MIRKIIGGICVLLATTGYGYQKGMEYQEEKEELERLMQVIWQIKGEISYTHTNLGEVFQRIETRVGEPYSSWAKALAGQMLFTRKGHLGQIWEEETTKQLSTIRINEEAWSELLNLGKNMDYLDVRMQEQSMEWYYERLNSIKKQLEKQLSEKKRLCSLLGVSGGLFIIILLF